MSASLIIGGGNFSTKAEALLGYTIDDNGNYKPIAGILDRASEASRINKSGVLVFEANDIARIDYTSGVGKLLLEGQSTNLALHSEDFNGNWGVNNLSYQTNSIISPDGTLNATKLIEDNTNSIHRTNSITIIGLPVDDYSTFIYAKKGERSFIYLRNGNATVFPSRAYFDLENGVVGSVVQGTASIEDVGNGWYKCIISNANTLIGNHNLQVYVTSGDGIESYQGDGTSGVHIWGAQIEASIVPTSYIKTIGSTVTRLKDILTGFGNVNTFNSEEGVIVAKMSALSDDLTERIISINDGSNTNAISIEYRGTTNFVTGRCNSSGGNTFVSTTVADMTDELEIAFKWKLNDFALYINEIEVGTDLSGSVPADGTLIAFDFRRGDTLNNLIAETESVKIYKSIAKAQVDLPYIT